MKTKFFSGLAVLLALIFVLTACSTGASQDSGSTPAVATSSDETWDLIWVQQSPAMSLDGGVFQDAFQRWLYNESDGRIRIIDMSAGALVPAGNELDAIASNQAQIGLVENMFESGNIVLNQACNLPMDWGYPATVQGGLVHRALCNEFPEMVEEFTSQDVMLLAGIFGPPLQYQTVKKPIHTLEDLKGLNMCELGTYAVEAAKILGMVPLSLSTTERVDALAKGVADGVEVNFNASSGFYVDSINYSTQASLSMPNCQYMVLSKEVYDSFPDDIKAIFSEENMKKAQNLFGYVRDTFDLNGRDKMAEVYKERGLPEIYLMPEEEVAKIKAVIVEPVKEIWIQDCRDAGHGELGVEIQEKLSSIINDYAWNDALEKECSDLLAEWQALPDIPEN
jgi:TRAP-type C4-dicarboxylate transport system substrate-binding protein